MRKLNLIFTSITALFLVLSLSGCDWVDSTGRVSNSTPVTVLTFADGVPASAALINEQTTRRILATGTDEDGVVKNYRWSAQPSEQGKLDACGFVANFDMQRAADSLQLACSNPANCQVVFEQQPGPDNGSAEFLISAPQLKSPVGVTYTLLATDNDGGVGMQQSTFCLMSINEAPDAKDDRFTVLEGVATTITPPAINLLSNDIDDDDTGDDALRVVTTAIREPNYAGTFELFADGGFIYEFSGTTLAQSTTDSFEYEITDGVFTSSATVTLRVVARDDPPVLIRSIPLQSVVAGLYFRQDLNQFFSDPEGSDLSFVVSNGELPPSGQVSLSATGILSGRSGTVDVGSHAVTVVASDGTSGVAADLTLTVTPNRPVLRTTIPTQSASLGQRFSLSAGNYFTDPENQPITFSVDSSNSAVDLTVNARTGAISGFFTAAGEYAISVFADDGTSARTRSQFAVDVVADNEPPRSAVTIASQQVLLDDAIVPINARFTDADGDPLTITVTGTLPRGLRLGTNGIVSGRVTQTGVFGGLRLVATDPSGGIARTNVFSITVLEDDPEEPPNIAPVYTAGTVFNQAVRVGAAITPVRPTFTDADDTVLIYSVEGAELPAGVTLNARTGVVSGRPGTAGWTTGLRIEATDSDGSSAVSENFWIRVF